MSYAMRPAPPSRSNSELDSTLGDSTYEVISNGDLISDSGILSDDDAHTESLASSISTSGEESDEENAIVTPLDNLIFPGQQADLAQDVPTVNITPTIGDSGYTSHTVRPGSPSTSSATCLAFGDDQNLPASPTEARLTHTVQTVNEPNCSMELGVYQAPFVGVSMRLAVSKGMAKPRSLYRILVLSYHPYFVGEVAAHIKSGLDQILWDNDINGKARLEVLYCIEAIKSSGRPEVSLCIDQHPDVTIRGGSAFILDDPYPLWDLAIFLHTSLADIPTSDIDSHEASFSSARLAMASSQVPIMDLSTHHPLYRAAPPTFTCRGKTLHLHVTTKESSTAKEISQELLPIDLDQFFAIDPRTLGRHLDCLSSPNNRRKAGTKPRNAIGSLRNGWSATQKTLNSYMAWGQNAIEPHVTRHEAYWSLQHFSLAHKCLVLLASVFIVFVAVQLQSYFLSETTTTTISTPSSEAPSIAANWAELFSKQTVSMPLEVEQELATSESREEIVKKMRTVAPVNTWVAERPLRRDIMKSSKSLQGTAQHGNTFTLNLVGAHTLVLTLTSDIALPRVTITVLQDGKELDTLVKSVSDGVWVVGIHKDQAQGQATVLVKGTNRNPQQGKRPFKYEFLVELGPTKTPFISVKDKVIEEVVIAQKNAKAISTRMTTGLQKYINHFESSTQQFQRHAMKRVDDTRKVLVRFSSPSDIIAKASNKKQQVAQFQEASESLHKETTALARTVQCVAIQQYHDAMQVIHAVQSWRERTAWPVRASDWKPRTAIKRGAGNAKGLIRLLGGGRTKKVHARFEQDDGCSSRGRYCKTSPPINHKR